MFVLFSKIVTVFQCCCHYVCLVTVVIWTLPPLNDSSFRKYFEYFYCFIYNHFCLINCPVKQQSLMSCSNCKCLCINVFKVHKILDSLSFFFFSIFKFKHKWRMSLVLVHSVFQALSWAKQIWKPLSLYILNKISIPYEMMQISFIVILVKIQLSVYTVDSYITSLAYIRLT